jgi:uncharacterized protein YjbJ (UPF0337 family)
MESIMNWDQVEGRWHQVKGKLRSKWGELSDDDLQNVAGKRELVIGKVQSCYGLLREEAERQVDDWIARLPLDDPNAHGPQ